MSKIKIKRDSYRSSRGGNTKILKLSCSSCNTLLFNYQKDGAGQLIRCYLDRMIPKYFEIDFNSSSFRCPNCGSIIGKLITYKKEKRLAYVLMRGAVKKT